MSAHLTHTGSGGEARMVNVGEKPPVQRRAKARGFIRLTPSTLRLVRDNEIRKGDVLSVARIAGIQGAKECPRLVPLCHPLNLTDIHVRPEITDGGILVESMVRCVGRTGVEMEALTAVQVALLTIYDMCKAVDTDMVMENIRLISKTKQPLSAGNGGDS